MKDDIIKLKDALKQPLFASRDSINEAWKYAESLGNSMTGSDQIALYTACGVLMNSISDHLGKIIEEHAGGASSN